MSNSTLGLVILSNSEVSRLLTNEILDSSQAQSDNSWLSHFCLFPSIWQISLNNHIYILDKITADELATFKDSTAVPIGM